MIFFPLARPSRKASTFDVVRLKTATVNPWLSMFRTRFSPITARPIRPMSALFGFVAMLGFLDERAFGDAAKPDCNNPTMRFRQVERSVNWLAGSGQEIRDRIPPRAQVYRQAGRSGSSCSNRAICASM